MTVMAFCDFGNYPSRELLRDRILENSEIDINSSDLAGNAKDAMSIPEQIALSLVVFMTGIAGNAAIPAISASLKNKNDIIFVAAVSYTAVSILYVVIACVGYWLDGEYTDVMIINDFFIWPQGPVISVISGLMIVNLWASLFIMLSLECDIIEKLIGIELVQHTERRLLRAGLLIAVFVGAYFTRNELTFIVAVSGVVGVLCSLALTMPILMYITTFWNHSTRPLSMMSKICHVAFLCISVAVGVFSGYTSCSKLL